MHSLWNGSNNNYQMAYFSFLGQSSLLGDILSPHSFYIVSYDQFYKLHSVLHNMHVL